MAINFPTSPNNGDIHTAEGIQWQWDNTGSTWKCQGVTGVYTLGIASVSSLGGIKIGNNLSINGTGVLSAVMNLNNESISELTDVTFNSITLDGSNGGGKVLAWDQSLQAFAPVDQSGGGGGGGSQTLDQVLATGNTTTRDIATSGKIYFSNNFPDLATLNTVSASTYHGMFAHVHAEGHGYFGHAGGWTQLLDAGSSIGELGDVDLSNAPQSLNVLTYTGTNWVANPITLAGNLGDVAISSPSDGDVLTYNNSAGRWQSVAPSGGGGGGGSGLTSRTTANATASNLADDASANITITAAKTYALLKIQTSHAAWVTLYTSNAARTADASRSEVTDPQPGSGVIAEVITTDGATQTITPGTIGWNDDGTPSTTAYVKVVNKSGSSQNLTVTLHFVQLEV